MCSVKYNHFNLYDAWRHSAASTLHNKCVPGPELLFSAHRSHRYEALSEADASRLANTISRLLHLMKYLNNGYYSEYLQDAHTCLSCYICTSGAEQHTQ